MRPRYAVLVLFSFFIGIPAILSTLLGTVDGAVGLLVAFVPFVLWCFYHCVLSPLEPSDKGLNPPDPPMNVLKFKTETMDDLSEINVEVDWGSCPPGPLRPMDEDAAKLEDGKWVPDFKQDPPMRLHNWLNHYLAPIMELPESCVSVRCVYHKFDGSLRDCFECWDTDYWRGVPAKVTLRDGKWVSEDKDLANRLNEQFLLARDEAE